MANLNQKQFQQLTGAGKPEPLTASLASALAAAQKALPSNRVPESVPVLGGMNLADGIGLTGTQGLVSDFSQGKNITGDQRMFDALGMLPMAAPAVNGAKVVAKSVAKAAPKVGKTLAYELARQVENGDGILSDIVNSQRSYILPPERFRGATLEGMNPLVDVDGRKELFGTDQRLVDLAKQHAQNMGIPYKEPAAYIQADPVRGARIAHEYDIMQNNPTDPRVKSAYDALINETMAQYDLLRKNGYKFDFMPDSGDIYGNPRNAINDIVQNKHMSVFPTESGFGSINDSLDSNPLLMRVGEKWNGKDVTANDIFRAVHDVFGHAKHGVGFRATGEENAFQSHAAMFSDKALPAVTSETRGQNSWVNFGKHGEHNRKASPADTIYADQKNGLLPDFVMRDGLRFK